MLWSSQVNSNMVKSGRQMFIHCVKFSYLPGCNPNTLHEPSFQRAKQSQLYNNKIAFIKKNFISLITLDQ